ncbi:MAG: hypothetical protein J6V50_04855 [Clostridia bacterium]|nr:hypothetical protein [Clostridia bacterium]
MNKLKFLFPLSFMYKTPKKFFAALLIYIAIYILRDIIPLGIVGTIILVYVYIGAAILMINYLLKNKDDKNETK